MTGFILYLFLIQLENMHEDSIVFCEIYYLNLIIKRKLYFDIDFQNHRPGDTYRVPKVFLRELNFKGMKCVKATLCVMDDRGR